MKTKCDNCGGTVMNNKCQYCGTYYGPLKPKTANLKNIHSQEINIFEVMLLMLVIGTSFVVKWLIVDSNLIFKN